MADPLDILTESEAQEAINVADAGSHAGELALAVSAVSQAVDAACGPVVAREVTEVHYGISEAIWPYQAPVLSVTSVTEFDGATSTVLTDESAFGTVATSSGFVLSDGYRIDRRSGRFVGQVQIVYMAGRFATTEDVSARFKYAAAAILRRLWKREGSAWAYTPDFYANTDEAVAGSSFFRAVEPMIAELLPDERRARFVVA
jgi:hypothetical protein